MACAKFALLVRSSMTTPIERPAARSVPFQQHYSPPSPSPAPRIQTSQMSMVTPAQPATTYHPSIPSSSSAGHEQTADEPSQPAITPPLLPTQPLSPGLDPLRMNALDHQASARPGQEAFTVRVTPQSQAPSTDPPKVTQASAAQRTVAPSRTAPLKKALASTSQLGPSVFDAPDPEDAGRRRTTSGGEEPEAISSPIAPFGTSTSPLVPLGNFSVLVVPSRSRGTLSLFC